MATADEYREYVLKGLLPKGDIWEFEEGSNMDRLLAGLSVELARLDQTAHAFIRDCNPLFVDLQLEAREAEAGLPDLCIGQLGTVAARRNLLLYKWASRGGASKNYFIQLARDIFNREITIGEFSPSRVGEAGIGDSLTSDAWAYCWQVNQSTNLNVRYFYTGSSEAGDYLLATDKDPLPCVFDRERPAHTTVLFEYNINQLRYSEQLDLAAYWTREGSPSVAINNATDPYARSNAESFAFAQADGIRQAVPKTINIQGDTFTFSIYAQGDVGKQLKMFVGSDVEGTQKTMSLNGNWVREQVSHTFSAGASEIVVRLFRTAAGTAQCDLWGAQLEASPAATTYQRKDLS